MRKCPLLLWSVTLLLTLGFTREAKAQVSDTYFEQPSGPIGPTYQWGTAYGDSPLAAGTLQARISTLNLNHSGEPTGDIPMVSVLPITSQTVVHTEE